MRINNGSKEAVEDMIQSCQRKGHVQQVAFSTYHHALTQVCFTCDLINTSMKEEDYAQEKEGGQ